MGIILISLWLCQVVFFGRIYKTMMINELKDQAKDLISLENDPAFDEIAKNISEDKSSCVSIYSHVSKSTHNVSDISYKDCYLYRLKIIR
jgi:hypothetical protein